MDEAHTASIREARRRSAAQARAWRASEPHRALCAIFDAVAADDAEAVATVAAGMLRGERIAGLLDPLVAALAADPWFEPPLRASRDAARTGAVLFDHPAVAISASILSAAALAVLPPPSGVVVSGRLTVVHYVRAGGATLRLWTADPVGADFCQAQAAPLRLLGDIALVDGMTLRIDGRVRASQIVAATGDVVALTAMVRAGAAPFQREYRLPDGALNRVATLDDGAARTQMLLTYLRHAGRADAAPWFEAATRDDAFFLRWAAMREWLALDARGALRRLRAMAGDGGGDGGGGDDNPEVRGAALHTLPMVEAACRS